MKMIRHEYDTIDEHAEDKSLLQSELWPERQPISRIISKKVLQEEVQYILRSKKRRVIKNVLILSFGIFLYYSGYQNMANFQSTINASKGLGMDAQAVIYGISMISSILLPKFAISYFGCKNVFVISIILSLPYMAANFYPKWYSLIPAAILFGLVTGPLNSAQYVYINEMAAQFQTLVPESLEIVLARFTSISTIFMENTQIWSNLVSYYVLKSTNTLTYNVTSQNCGVHFENLMNNVSAVNPNLSPPEDNKRHLLTGINTVICVLSAIIIAIFLDPLKYFFYQHNEPGDVSSAFLAASKQLSNADQLLLIPMSVFLGMELAFFTGDFTQAFIACYWSVHHVGFVVMCFGICGVISALTIGTSLKYLNHTLLLTGVAIVHATLLVALFKLKFQATILYLFLISGIWGASDAIWWSQVAAIYGIQFRDNKEAAFSNFSFWTSAGFFISYSYSNLLKIPIKIYILGGVLTSGVIGHFILRIRMKFQLYANI